MFFGDPYSRPEIIGSVDAVWLDELVEQMSDTYIETKWHSPASKNYGIGALPEALTPIHDFILSHEISLGRHEPRAIRYSVETDPVIPGKSQRGHGWHVDGSGKNDAFVVANCLPTEFLVRKKERWLSAANFLPHISKNIPLHLSDEKLEQKELTVYRPDPYEVAAFSSNVHRSPVNEGQVVMPRSFIRAVIIRRRGDSLLDI